MLNICIIGGGNISNTRHIPAIMKTKCFNIIGVISDDNNKIVRTLKKQKIRNIFLLDRNLDFVEQLSKCEWFSDNVDAVIIGTPPKEHYKLTKCCLTLNKHVLVEKPMMMSTNECEDVATIASEKNLVFQVMHSFQYSSGIIKLDKLNKENYFGSIESILEIQLSNRKRRLPKWYDDLPLGLFYDEAAHFFYCANRFGGKLEVLNATAQFSNDNMNTPKFLQVQLNAGKIPVQMLMNFNSPICEWGFILLGTEKIAIYDYFKDILIVLNNDDLHLAKNILKTSLQFSYQFWKGFILNGMKMISGNLLYGHDIVIRNFHDAIVEGTEFSEISSSLGTEIVEAMNNVNNLIHKEKL